VLKTPCSEQAKQWRPFGSTRKSRVSSPASSPVEHDALIATLPRAVSNDPSESSNSRMSQGVMSVDQATVKKVLLACLKSDPRTE
jgi:hypothetical protein